VAGDSSRKIGIIPIWTGIPVHGRLII